IADRLAALGCPKEKISMVRLGAPVPLKDQLRKVSSDTVKIVCVASLLPVKGHRYLIDAFGKAYTKVPKLRLTLIGDGPERQAIEVQIQRNQLSKAVTLKGWLTSEKVQDELRKADIYAQASYRYIYDGNTAMSEEGLPISMVEAAAYGIPIIGTDSGGIKEICHDKINGC
ncbi:MAG: glycosyltransferase family 4 protein, partial [Bacteroides sp.]|nr:glycosyltransferase family 4 protein [Bacteroides sp.]